VGAGSGGGGAYRVERKKGDTVIVGVSGGKWVGGGEGGENWCDVCVEERVGGLKGGVRNDGYEYK